MKRTKKELLQSAGFGTEVEAVESGLCPFCGKTVEPEKLRDDLSRKEFSISGLCQECQDGMFGGG